MPRDADVWVSGDMSGLRWLRRLLRLLMEVPGLWRGQARLLVRWLGGVTPAQALAVYALGFTTGFTA